MTFTETFRHPIPGFDFFDLKWGPSVSSFWSGLELIYEKLCFSRIPFWNPYIVDPWFYDLFHCVPAWIKCLTMGRRINLRQALHKSLDLSRHQVWTSLWLQTWQSGLSSFVPADPARSVTSHRDPPPQALQPLPEGRKDASSVVPAPPPEEEPYDSYLKHTGHTKMDSVRMTPQATAVATHQDSVTLPAFFQPLPWPFPTYEGKGTGFCRASLRCPAIWTSYAAAWAFLLPGTSA